MYKRQNIIKNQGTPKPCIIFFIQHKKKSLYFCIRIRKSVYKIKALKFGIPSED